MNIDDIIENAQLKGRIIALDAQVETLTAEVRCLEAVVRSHERVDCLLVANLKAENDRLRKAGDAMASSIQFNEEMAQDYNGPPIVHQCVREWNAAKEGTKTE